MASEFYKLYLENFLTYSDKYNNKMGILLLPKLAHYDKLKGVKFGSF